MEAELPVGEDGHVDDSEGGPRLVHPERGHGARKALQQVVHQHTWNKTIRQKQLLAVARH